MSGLTRLWPVGSESGAVDAAADVSADSAAMDSAAVAAAAMDSAAVAAAAMDDAAVREAAVREAYGVADRTTPWTRANFIASLDGSATLGGTAGGLGTPADQFVLRTLREQADAVVVGAGTVRAEGYGSLGLDDDARARRRSAGLADEPVLVIVSGRLDLDPAAAVFADAVVRPIVATAASAPGDARSRLEGVADVVDCGRESVEPARLVAALHARGMTQLLCEGGPSLFGSLAASGLIDELCLTLSPTIVGGDGTRISVGAPEAARGMRLAQLLHAEGLLFARYVRAR